MRVETFSLKSGIRELCILCIQLFIIPAQVKKIYKETLKMKRRIKSVFFHVIMVHLENARECKCILLDLMKEVSDVQEFLKKIKKGY